MHILKKAAAFLLVLTLALSFCACATVGEILSDEEVQQAIVDLVSDDGTEEASSSDSETGSVSHSDSASVSESEETSDLPAGSESDQQTDAVSSAAEQNNEIEQNSAGYQDEQDLTWDDQSEATKSNLDQDGVEYLDPDGSYTSKDDVALYIHQYGCLPSNFITKKQAQALGWTGGSLEPYAPGKSIGGDYFGNYENQLPSGHTWTECDIDTMGASSRGAKRIVFSSDGLIYYSGDHYETFTLLYGG